MLLLLLMMLLLFLPLLLVLLPFMLLLLPLLLPMLLLPRFLVLGSSGNVCELDDASNIDVNFIRLQVVQSI